MTNKRKKRVRQRMQSTGLSYQAVTNLAERPSTVERLDYCPSCDGRYFEYKHGTVISLVTYDHKPGCMVGEMKLVPGSDQTRCDRCGHLEPITRKPPYGFSTVLHCPTCFERLRKAAETTYEYGALSFHVHLPTTTAEDLAREIDKKLATCPGWKADKALGAAYVYREDGDHCKLDGVDIEGLLTKREYAPLLMQAAAHPHEAHYMRLVMYIQMPLLTVQRMKRE